MPTDKKMALEQIDAALKRYEQFADKHYRKPGAPVSFQKPDFHRDNTELKWCMMETLRRLAPPKSKFAVHPEEVEELVGVLMALRADFEAGYIQTFQELVHGDTFSDFLTMAEHLSSEGFKDAAAVIAGGVLEQHLRELSTKTKIDTTTIDKTGRTHQKMINEMNSDLYRADIYGKQFMQLITAWGTIRNHAAHGEYSEVDAELVKLMVAGIRNLILNFPA